MKYISTRGASAPVTAEQAILTGIAPDGGLYLPESVPVFSKEDLAEIAASDYRSAALKVLRPYLLSFTDDELVSCVGEAYARFDTSEPVQFQNLGNGLNVMELWHGPTAAFKDMALQLFPRLMPLCKAKCCTAEETWILTATSGDTGKAALEGFCGVPGTRILVFYPYGGVSRIQELQMTTQQGDNVGVFAVRGNFDDAQTGVKRLFGDASLAARLAERGVRLSSANSINWGRLLPQIVYYVYASARLSVGGPVDFIVPTGNFGNIFAGYLAKLMGAPVGRLVCASNRNRVLTDFFETGVYDRRRPFYKTASPSMDILISSNLERLLYLASGRDAERVAAWMRELAEQGSYAVPDSVMEPLRETFSFGFADDNATVEAISACWNEHRYLLDPHTAVGYAVYRGLQDPSDPAVLVSTANSYKFAPDVLKAFGLSADGFEAQDLLAAETGVLVPASLSTLREKTVRFNTVLSPEEMKTVLL